MKVALRQRRKTGLISLYLDYYDRGKRWYEYLGLYLSPEGENGKLNRVDREENKRIMQLAEAIRGQRLIELQNGKYDFYNQAQLQANFLEYFQKLASKRKDSLGNYGNWQSAFHYIKDYSGTRITFAELDTLWIEGLREYLLQEAKTQFGQPLARNTAISYFNKVKAAIRQAHIDGILRENPAIRVKGIKEAEVKREYLTLEELQKLASTPCKSPLLKQVFLFSCLTGLRWSDIEKLTWSEVQYSEATGYFLRFRQKKTKSMETLPISEQARKLMGIEQIPGGKVFFGLSYNSSMTYALKEWIRDAGINKKITFHCARHTYATLLLTKGADIYTVSKMLGHKELRTTQIYTNLIDEKKREAADKMTILIKSHESI